MTSPHLTPHAPHTPAPDPGAAALTWAAEAYLAHTHPRAPLRLDRVTLSGVTYACAPDPAALRLNRALAEEVVMVALAAREAAALTGAPAPGAGRDARMLLDCALTDPDERETLDAYLSVLRGRARARLRRAWSEVQVIAAGLREHGELDAAQVAHRVACAQGIRATLLN
ncbi:MULTISPECIES: hypothetical protein [Deinococcus]|uniref:Uncharacterized protein n=2 Tax=Deinococcus soli (ex Cha et al. 2016) TaxID=1309411 RepID=A0A0F7JKH4_9DEIO|nr:MULTISPECIES: hypothetical protein [Deinococcus]AKH16721.1 hypothetical protein SY84_06210 [Deinococcus soli (ex Cha et al. 2016)]MDK2013364.1 hypothetical protein [Deinococcus sp. 43]MDR6220134.1 hypothetical protein [Deinococcus soli (ex Cha et al. 2016)]MDR6329989.1 hypothetical protein [Deinococcus soli (ex Cha et al. 2016)]MDR6753380.1 hypothetical protein [Deinococcus soli (ex Cha et al. 2016)]